MATVSPASTGSIFDDINFADAGGAVQSLFGAAGDLTESSAYQTAASYAKANEQQAATSTAIQQAQENRAIYQGLGSETAGYAGGGLASSGSALDVMRSSAQQGALKKQLIGTQGQIQENAYAAQANSFEAMSQTAQESAAGGGLGGLLKGVASVFNLF